MCPAGQIPTGDHLFHVSLHRQHKPLFPGEAAGLLLRSLCAVAGGREKSCCLPRWACRARHLQFLEASLGLDMTGSDSDQESEARCRSGNKGVSCCDLEQIPTPDRDPHLKQSQSQLIQSSNHTSSHVAGHRVPSMQNHPV